MPRWFLDSASDVFSETFSLNTLAKADDTTFSRLGEETTMSGETGGAGGGGGGGGGGKAWR